MKYLKKFLGLFYPRQEDEDLRRKELILNIILAFSLLCFLMLNVVRVYDIFIRHSPGGLPFWITTALFIFFCFLLVMSHRGHIGLAARLVCLLFALPLALSAWLWGSDLPAVLLLAVLLITLSGILIGARTAFTSTALISMFFIAHTWAANKGIISVDSSWRLQENDILDTFSYSMLLMVIATVAWLFCREINRSLARAKRSEALLRRERDQLEVKVEERTRELMEAEQEKINQLYRLAEFGRLSSGIFHDLINPLTAVSLNLEQLRSESDARVADAKSHLTQALIATDRMAGLVSSIKKQIARDSSIKPFSPLAEIQTAIQILDFKARRDNVRVSLLTEHDFKIEGDPLKFGQVASNLIANAIEACEGRERKEVQIALSNNDNDLIFEVIDSGCGIYPEDLGRIFDRFFSTKHNRGLGIGLASTKAIIEKDFTGKIQVTSEPSKGSRFLVTIPLCPQGTGQN